LSDGGVGPIAVAAVEARQLRFAIGEELFGPDVLPQPYAAAYSKSDRGAGIASACG
jgi:hypothetical protein